MAWAFPSPTPSPTRIDYRVPIETQSYVHHPWKNKRRMIAGSWKKHGLHTLWQLIWSLTRLNDSGFLSFSIDRLTRRRDRVLPDLSSYRIARRRIGYYRVDSAKSNLAAGRRVLDRRTCVKRNRNCFSQEGDNTNPTWNSGKSLWEFRKLHSENNRLT